MGMERSKGWTGQCPVLFPSEEHSPWREDELDRTGLVCHGDTPVVVQLIQGSVLWRPDELLGGVVGLVLSHNARVYGVLRGGGNRGEGTVAS